MQSNNGYGPAWHWGILVGFFGSLTAIFCLLDIALGAWACFVLCMASDLICIIRILTEDKDERYMPGRSSRNAEARFKR